jgi:flagellar motor switch protein FliG
MIPLLEVFVNGVTLSDMGVYTRFKRTPGGFRALVELLETTPVSRRQKMIDVGMAEDPDYTLEALKYVLNFDDIVKLSDPELAEVLSKAPPRTTAFAISAASDDIKARFVRSSKPPVAAEIRSYMGVKCGLREMGGAQMKLIEVTRQLEKAGYVKTKHIPDDGRA